MVLGNPQTNVLKTRELKVKVQNKARYSRSSYSRDIRAAVRGFWNSELDFFTFFESFSISIERGLTAAWYEGAAQCGIEPDEMTIDEMKLLRFKISEQMNYLNRFAEVIEAGSKENGGKLTPLMKRAQLWVNRYNDVRNEARVSACKDSKLKWILGLTEQHCRTCFALNGKVKRASFWKILGVRPQNAPNHLLECEGWLCDCELSPTDEPVTRGAMPSLP